MLELQNVTYRVQDELGEKTILNNVNLKLDDHFVAFTGPNGGGKSTLAKVIAGIVKPTEGKIFFDGKGLASNLFAKVVHKVVARAHGKVKDVKGHIQPLGIVYKAVQSSVTAAQDYDIILAYSRKEAFIIRYLGYILVNNVAVI